MNVMAAAIMSPSYRSGAAFPWSCNQTNLAKKCAEESQVTRNSQHRSMPTTDLQVEPLGTFHSNWMQ